MGFKYTDVKSNRFDKYNVNLINVCNENGVEYVKECIEIFLEKGSEVNNVNTTVYSKAF